MDEKKQRFSDEIKETLLKNEPKSACCRNSFICGVALFARKRKNDFSRRAEELATRLKQRNAKAQKKNEFFGNDISALGYRAYEIDGNAVLDERGNRCPHCAEHLMSGAFLAAGRVGSPEGATYLELVMPNEAVADRLSLMLEEKGMPTKRTLRRGELLLYYKKAECIEDFLSFIGAVASSFKLINQKIVTEYRIYANRQKNCDTSNIKRTLGAAGKQVEAIRALEQAELLDELADELKLTAHIRAENPLASLDQLIALHPEPISRSGIQHRLNKLIDIAVKKGVFEK